MTHEEQIAKLTEMLEIQQKLHETAIDMLKPAIEIAVQKEREAIAHMVEPWLLPEYVEKIRARGQAYFAELIKRPWVGLTDEDKKKLARNHPYASWEELCSTVETKLKEKNT
jgi:hypothetical protein